jgi:Haloacid dehalogenase-like hydrolase
MDNWIIFDVDDVLCNFRESLYCSFKNIGKDVHWTQWTKYASLELYGLKNEQELHLHMATHNVLENSKVEEGVPEFLVELKEAGFNIGLLTARAWHQNGKTITEDFVHNNNLCVDKIVISGLHTDKKSEHIDKFNGNITAYVDDSIHHIEDFISKGISNSYLMDRPWNQSSELPRINDFHQFRGLVMPQPKNKFRP